MKNLHAVLALAVLSTSFIGTVALAQDHHDSPAYVEHKEWKKGAPIKREDWDRGDKIDYRQNHLSTPPRSGEWRAVDGQPRSREQFNVPDPHRCPHTVTTTFASK